MTTQTRFTCQCPRCDSTGRFDRGVCFECKGLGYVSRTNTRGLTPFVLTVTYENGSINTPRVFASRRENAVAIVERQLRLKGWVGTVA
jgi:DnaJ-class molecular chaperone